MREEKTHINRDAGGPVLAAIDLGTNACRLLIAVPDSAGLRVIGSYSANVRLGEGLDRDGSLGDDALDRAVAALAVCADHMKRHRVTHTRAIATEACRRAANTDALIARTLAETGIELCVVTAAEEAQLAAEGCADLIGEDFDGALVFDIGGGSTELILARRDDGRPSVVAWCSIPIGVVALAEHNGGRQLDGSAFGAMRAEVDAAFARERAALGGGAFDAARHHLLGTSGTLTTLAGVKLGLARYERRRIDGQWLEEREVRDLVARLADSDFHARAAIPCVGTDRADLILPGCAILSAIMDYWPCARLRVADRGLREGMLTRLMHEARA